MFAVSTELPPSSCSSWINRTRVCSISFEAEETAWKPAFLSEKRWTFVYFKSFWSASRFFSFLTSFWTRRCKTRIPDMILGDQWACIVARDDSKEGANKKRSKQRHTSSSSQRTFPVGTRRVSREEVTGWWGEEGWAGKGNGAKFTPWGY